MKQILFFLSVLSVFGILFGCGPTKPQGSQPTGKVFEPAEEPGQIPYPILESASNRYGGAMQDRASASAAQTPAAQGRSGMQAMTVTKSEPMQASSQSSTDASQTTGQLTKAPAMKMMSVVLGPVSSDDAQKASGDAGQRIREVISQELSSMDGLTLIDAPEERYKNDSPRPDLAAKGIRFVIKGTSSYNPESENTTVFLRIVATQSGKVSGVASGRGPTQDEAAKETTQRLIRKLERAP